MLRRPVVDPHTPVVTVSRSTAPGAFLTPAGWPGLARRYDILPADPGQRGATIDGGVIGLVAAAFTAVGGSVPLAIGVLVFSGAGRAGSPLRAVMRCCWRCSSRSVTAVVFGRRDRPLLGQFNGLAPAEAAARTYHGRYLTGVRFRRPGQSPAAARARRRGRRHLLAGLPGPARRSARRGAPPWTEQEWDTPWALREQAGLRAKRAELAGGHPGYLSRRGGRPAAGPAGGPAARPPRSGRASPPEDSVASRVAALERYVAEIREADAAYRDWRQATALADSAASTWTCWPAPRPTSTTSPRSKPCRGTPCAIQLALREPRD